MTAASAGRTLLGIAIAFILLAFSTITTPPAHAEEPPLEFSADGTTWTSAPPAALFGDDVVLVPGGSVTAALHLRSIAPTPGILEVSFTNVRISSAEAGRAFGLGAITEVGTGDDAAGVGLPRTRFADLIDDTPAGPPITLVPGQSARFLLTIDLEPDPHEASTQATGVSLDVALAFRDAAAVQAPEPSSAPRPPSQVIPMIASDPEQPSPPGRAAGSFPTTEEGSATAPYPGFLALTGVTRTVFLVVATGMIAGGLLLLLAARGRKRDHERAAPDPDP